MTRTIEASVIIPCFNAEKYIGRCLSSIIKSSYRNFEIIIIDDGSSDRTVNLINSYKKNKRIKLFKLQKNEGASVARNFGVKQSRAKIVIFFDADCIMTNNCLKLMVEVLKNNHKIGAVQACLINKTKDSGHFLTFFGFPYSVEEARIIFGAKTAAMGIRKDLFDALGGFDEDYKIYGEDTDLSWRIWLSGYKIISAPGALVHHATRGSLSPETKHRIFYEGAKNSTSNIIKNAGSKILAIILPLHIIAWTLTSFKLIFQLRLVSSFNISKGIVWNISNLPWTLKKRKMVKRVGERQAEKVMFGNVGFADLFTKGWRWFFDV